MDVGFTPVSDAPPPSTLKRPLENPTVTPAPRKKVSFAGETPTATETSPKPPPSTATKYKDRTNGGASSVGSCTMAQRREAHF